MKAKDISKQNETFWDELCGSQLARQLGVKDSSIESLKIFDDWYFNFYPYLFTYIPFSQLKGKDVLEIGLGYGTVSQRLAESGCNYTGLDIAHGPVQMVNQRLLQNNLSGKAIQGSILEQNLPGESYDYIIAIGCLHHTGNLQLAIEQCYRLLKPGGKLVFMVYYAYSYRRFRMASWLTISYLLKELLGIRNVVGSSNDLLRAAYDASSSGEGAPHTDWISKKSLRYYCRSFTKFEASIENIDQEVPFQYTTRAQLIKTRWPSLVGLDIYATATK